jgi:hypothetical protein
MSRKSNNVFLYIHTRKDNGIIFYVGIGVGKRPYDKGKGQRNYKWLEIVLEAGGFDVTILKTNMTWDEAGDLEVKMIAFYGREDKGFGSLCNLTDGKDGCLGRVMSDKQKKSMVDKQRKTYDEFISQVEELWGFDLQIDREIFNREYYNQKSKITLECTHHGIFQRRASDIVSKRKSGCPDCMKIRKSNAMKSYVRTEEYRRKSSESKKGINKQTKEYIERLKVDMIGSNNHFAKLSDDDVRFIRMNHKVRDKDFSAISLTKRFGVSKGTIHSVISGKTYSDVV